MGALVRYSDERDKMVVKANTLIQKSRFSLSTQQQKVILYLISKIEYNDDDFKLYEFKINDFCRVCGIDMQGGKTYGELKAQIQQIADKSVWIRLSDKRETLIRWIERPYIDEGSGTVQIKLDEYMRPFLLQLRQNFTQYEIINILAMRSKYSIRLYELVKSIHFHELDAMTKTYPVDELRKLLDADKYTRFCNFNQRVLKPAIAEINQYTDKMVSCKAIMKGRKAEAVELTISTKDLEDRLKTRMMLNEKLGPLQISFWE